MADSKPAAEQLKVVFGARRHTVLGVYDWPEGHVNATTKCCYLKKSPGACEEYAAGGCSHAVLHFIKDNCRRGKL
jgi:hypothetical protein